MVGPRCDLRVVAELHEMETRVDANHVESVFIILPEMERIPIFHRKMHVLSEVHDLLDALRASGFVMPDPPVVVQVRRHSASAGHEEEGEGKPEDSSTTESLETF